MQNVSSQNGFGVELQHTRTFGLPIPDVKRAAAQKTVFEDMAVGESVLVVGQKPSKVGVYIFRAEKRSGFCFTRRQEAEGVRVWRTA